MEHSGTDMTRLASAESHEMQKAELTAIFMRSSCGYDAE